MNYEERYNKALERAKKMLASKRSVIVKRQALETIFPELKESEDERIRKGILNYLVSRGFSHEWIAWLEKQGEKPQGKPIMEVWKDMRLEVLAQASVNRHEPNLSYNNTKMFSLNDIDEIIEKISEQNLANSAKICKEDEEMLDSIIEDFGNGKTSNMLQEQWLKSLKERFGCEANCTTKKNEE